MLLHNVGYSLLNRRVRNHYTRLGICAILNLIFQISDYMEY